MNVFYISATSFIQDGKELTSWEDKIYYNRRDLVIKDISNLIDKAMYHYVSFKARIVITMSANNYLYCHSNIGGSFETIEDIISERYKHMLIRMYIYMKTSAKVKGVYCDIVKEDYMGIPIYKPFYKIIEKGLYIGKKQYDIRVRVRMKF